MTKSMISGERNLGINTGTDDTGDQFPRCSSVLVTPLTALESDDNLWVVVAKFHYADFPVTSATNP